MTFYISDASYEVFAVRFSVLTRFHLPSPQSVTSLPPSIFPAASVHLSSLLRHSPESRLAPGKRFDRLPFFRYPSGMTSPQKWQLTLAGVAIAGISGWIVAWRLWQERDEREAGLPHPAGRTIVQ